MGVVGLGDQYVVGGGVFVGFGFDFFGGVVWDCLYCGGVCVVGVGVGYFVFVVECCCDF